MATKTIYLSPDHDACALAQDVRPTASAVYPPDNPPVVVDPVIYPFSFDYVCVKEAWYPPNDPSDGGIGAQRGIGRLVWDLSGFIDDTKQITEIAFGSTTFTHAGSQVDDTGTTVFISRLDQFCADWDIDEIGPDLDMYADPDPIGTCIPPTNTYFQQNIQAVEFALSGWSDALHSCTLGIRFGIIGTPADVVLSTSTDPSFNFSDASWVTMQDAYLKITYKELVPKPTGDDPGSPDNPGSGNDGPGDGGDNGDDGNDGKPPDTPGSDDNHNRRRGELPQMKPEAAIPFVKPTANRQDVLRTFLARLKRDGSEQ